MLKKLWNKITGQQPPSAAAVAGAATCSASWTEYVWTEKGYVQCGHLEARAETVEAASAELEKQMALPMMPNAPHELPATKTL